MTLKSIEKLRESLKACTSEAGVEPNRFDTYWITARACDMLIDGIESEIAERYMELPVDADGVPFKMGDEVVIPKCYEGTVVSIEVGDMDTIIGVDGHDGYLRYGISDVHHVKPRTVEDVLKEFGDWYKHVAGGCDEPGIIAKYADELRGMGVDNG